MPKQLDDILIHNYTKHSNKMIPYSEFVGFELYPEQNTNFLNKIVTVSCRDRSRILLDEEGNEIIQRVECKIVRFDKDLPGKAILISTDYLYIFVIDTKDYSEDLLFIYSPQFSELIGLHCKDQYVATIEEYDSYILMANSIEPTITVLVEILDNNIRYVLGDECFSKAVDNIVESDKSLQEIIKIRKNILETVYRRKNDSL